MSTLINIRIKGVPGIYPVYAYEDKIVTATRPIRTGYFRTMIVTDKPYSLPDDPLKMVRTAQALVYDKYEITLYVHESMPVGLLEVAGFVIIEFPDGTYHIAKIISMSDGERLAGTAKFKYVVTYADTNDENYGDRQMPIVDILESKKLYTDDRYVTTQLNSIEFKVPQELPGDDNEFRNAYVGVYPLTEPFQDGFIQPYRYKILTALNIEKVTVTEDPRSARDGSNQLKVSRFNYFKGIEFKAYVKETEANILMRYLPMCWGNGGKTMIYDRINGLNYTAIEPTFATVERLKDSPDLYVVNIIMKYANIDFTPFA